MNEALLHFYVYVYLDPRKPGNFKYGEYEFDYEPFYVGKGYGFRYKRHLTEYQLEHDNNKLKTNKIKKIIKETGEKPIRTIYKENMFEQDAFNLETLMIKTIGRIDLKKGPLTNLTNGGEGETGRICSEEQKEKLRNRIVLEETRIKISNANKGKISWCKGLNKETNESLKKQGTTFKQNYIDGKIKERNGENNPNFNNRWDEEQRNFFSDFQKVNSNFSLNNPQKINPNRGIDCGNSQYKYLIYDNEVLMLETYSLIEASEKLNLNYNMLRKISVNNHKYLKRYSVKRIKYKE